MRNNNNSNNNRNYYYFNYYYYYYYYKGFDSTLNEFEREVGMNELMVI